MATTYIDFDREWDLDSEHGEEVEGLRVPDLLSDLTRVEFPRSDLDGECEPYCHSSMLATFLWRHKRIT